MDWALRWKLARAYQDLRLRATTARRREPDALDPDPLIARRAIGHQPYPGHPQPHRPVGWQKAIDRVNVQHRAESYPNVKHRVSSSLAPCFQPAPEQGWQLVDAFSPVMQTGCGTYRPATRKILPGPQTTQGRR